MVHHWYARLQHQAQILLAIFFPLLFLSACALQNPFTQPSLTTKEYPEKSPLLRKVDQLQQGDFIKLDDPAFGGQLQATVLQSYFSAAGVDCKRLLMQTMTKNRKILICNTLDEGWSIIPLADN